MCSITSNNPTAGNECDLNRALSVDAQITVSSPLRFAFIAPLDPGSTKTTSTPEAANAADTNPLPPPMSKSVPRPAGGYEFTTATMQLLRCLNQNDMSSTAAYTSFPS